MAIPVGLEPTTPLRRQVNRSACCCFYYMFIAYFAKCGIKCVKTSKGALFGLLQLLCKALLKLFNLRIQNLQTLVYRIQKSYRINEAVSERGIFADFLKRYGQRKPPLRFIVPNEDCAYARVLNNMIVPRLVVMIGQLLMLFFYTPAVKSEVSLELRR